MSNEVTIQTTEFKNVPQDKVSFGVRMYDSYSQQYDKLVNDFLNTFPEYVQLEKRIKELRDEGWEKERVLKDKNY
jgi:hypothetical protein